MGGMFDPERRFRTGARGRLRSERSQRDEQLGSLIRHSFALSGRSCGACAFGTMSWRRGNRAACTISNDWCECSGSVLGRVGAAYPRIVVREVDATLIARGSLRPSTRGTGNSKCLPVRPPNLHVFGQFDLLCPP